MKKSSWYTVSVMRKQNLDTPIPLKKKSKKNVVHADGSGYDDIVLARRRGVFGTALIVLAISLLILVI